MEWWIVNALVGIVGCGLVWIGFWAGCDFRKHQASEAEKRAKQAEANWDAAVRGASREIGLLNERLRKAVARRTAADATVDRILDVIHEDRNKQAERDTMNAGTSSSGQ
jgi:hypothetical protein